MVIYRRKRQINGMFKTDVHMQDTEDLLKYCVRSAVDALCQAHYLKAKNRAKMARRLVLLLRPPSKDRDMNTQLFKCVKLIETAATIVLNNDSDDEKLQLLLNSLYDVQTSNDFMRAVPNSLLKSLVVLKNDAIQSTSLARNLESVTSELQRTKKGLPPLISIICDVITSNALAGVYATTSHNFNAQLCLKESSSSGASLLLVENYIKTYVESAEYQLRVLTSTRIMLTYNRGIIALITGDATLAQNMLQNLLDYMPNNCILLARLAHCSFVRFLTDTDYAHLQTIDSALAMHTLPTCTIPNCRHPPKKPNDKLSPHLEQAYKYASKSLRLIDKLCARQQNDSRPIHEHCEIAPLRMSRSEFTLFRNYVYLLLTSIQLSLMSSKQMVHADCDQIERYLGQVINLSGESMHSLDINIEIPQTRNAFLNYTKIYQTIIFALINHPASLSRLELEPGFVDSVYHRHTYKTQDSVASTSEIHQYNCAICKYQQLERYTHNGPRMLRQMPALLHAFSQEREESESTQYELVQDRTQQQ